MICLGFISVDLGTTNVKVAAFTDRLDLIALESEKVVYSGWQDRVEFDPDAYFKQIIKALCRLTARLPNTEPVRQIVLTGQAESLVVLDAGGQPLRAGISWLDSRSGQESADLQQAFPPETAVRITGQTVNTPTWPISKILWLRRHEPESFRRAAHFILLKDYIAFRLTGRMVGEHTIYCFSYYFDYRKKSYWQEILDWCGVRPELLPELVEPCSVVGCLKAPVARELNLDSATPVNIGTLDHFAGMIGTGGISEGTISESTGTVVSLTALVRRPLDAQGSIPCHCGPFPGSYVLMPVCESGGISLEWFRNNFAPDLSFSELDAQAAGRERPSGLVFLPYLTGTNAPDFNPDAQGIFYGCRLQHDRIDLALAVMEGVAWMLHRNIDYLRRAGIAVDRIIATGGGAKSALWCQIKADLTGCPYLVPAQPEAASLGCAIIGAVSSGLYDSYEQCIAQTVRFRRQHQPAGAERYARLNRLYDELETAVQQVFRLGSVKIITT